MVIRRQVELALEALLDDLHVQEAEEAAAEAEAQRRRALGLEGERGVVQAELVDRVAQVLVVLGDHREEAGEDHRLHFHEARAGVERRAVGVGDGVADLRLDQVADVGVDVADLADRELLHLARLRVVGAELLDRVDPAGGDELDLVAALQRAVDDPDETGDAAIGVVPGVEEQRLQRGVRIPDRRRNVAHDALEELVDADAGLGRGEHRVRGVDADDLLDLLLGAVDVGRRQVDLVDHRQQLEAAVDGEIGVGERLRFDPLRRVDDQQRPFAGGERARHLVGEVDVPGGVDQVEDVGLAVLRLVVEPHGARLDGDAALALEVHVVEQLGVHLALRHRAGALEDAVGERRLAVVDVRDDREVADVGGRRHRCWDRRRGLESGAAGQESLSVRASGTGLG